VSWCVDKTLDASLVRDVQDENEALDSRQTLDARSRDRESVQTLDTGQTLDPRLRFFSHNSSTWTGCLRL
jgi:hypothetical protein